MNGDFREHRIGRRMPRGLYMLRPMSNDYAPVFMQCIDGVHYYRLVVSRRSGEDREHNLIYVGDRLVRWMHNTRLPDIIKSKLAMVDAVDTDWKARMSRSSLPPGSHAAYRCPDRDLIEVGWRVDEDMYTVIVPEETIDSLRGEPIDKEKRK
jgi:hypothetical protein